MQMNDVDTYPTDSASMVPNVRAVKSITRMAKTELKKLTQRIALWHH